MAFEKKARPTGEKQLRQNDTGRTEFKRRKRVFKICGAFLKSCANIVAGPVHTFLKFGSLFKNPVPAQ